MALSGIGIGMAAYMQQQNNISPAQAAEAANVTTVSQAKQAGMSQADISGLEKSGQITCETCATRMYQDGSDEMVSFKSATHLSPERAASAVRSHEQEHVSNAYSKAAQNNGQVLRATVSIYTARCPECGRIYVSGGNTSTQIRYNTDNPYGKTLKKRDEASIVGQGFDMTLGDGKE